VAVFTETEQDEVKGEEGIPVRPKEIAKQLLVQGRRLCGFHLSADPVNVSRRDGDVVEKPLPGEAVVALSMVRGHAALVSPEQVNPAPGDLRRERGRGQEAVERLGRPAAAECRGEPAPRRDGPGRLRGEESRRRTGQGGRR